MSEKKITLSLTARQLRRLFSKEPEKTIEQIRDQIVSGLWKEFMEKTAEGRREAGKMKIEVTTDFYDNGNLTYQTAEIFLDEEFLGNITVPKEKYEEFKRRLEAANEED